MDDELDPELELSKKFIVTYPQEVAGYLLQQDVVDTAALLSQLEVDDTAKIFSYLLPHYAARVVKELAGEYFERVLPLLDLDIIANLSRPMSQTERDYLYNFLDASKRSYCQEKLSYDENAVGSHMQSLTFAIPVSLTCGQTTGMMEVLQAKPQDPLLVIDTKFHLAGLVAKADLVAAKPETGVTVIMQPAPPAIVASASINIALQHVGWEAFDILPVVNQREQVIGSLRFRSLSKAVERQLQLQQAVAKPKPITTVLNIYSQLLAGIASNLTTLKIGK